MRLCGREAVGFYQMFYKSCFAFEKSIEKLICICNDQRWRCVGFFSHAEVNKRRMHDLLPSHQLYIHILPFLFLSSHIWSIIQSFAFWSNSLSRNSYLTSINSCPCGFLCLLYSLYSCKVWKLRPRGWLSTASSFSCFCRSSVRLLVFLLLHSVVKFYQITINDNTITFDLFIQKNCTLYHIFNMHVIM